MKTPEKKYFIMFGTTGELIKLIPVIEGLKNRKMPFVSIGLIQQQEQLSRFYNQYKSVPRPDIWTMNGFRGRDLAKFYEMPLWALRAVFVLMKLRKQVKKLAASERKNNYMLVHGDTVTTVLGALFGLSLGFKVVHIEAGLRSFHILHPFPEELDRIIVSKIARYHFAPGKAPLKNLKKAKAKGVVVSTGINTVYDSIKTATKMKPAYTIKNLPTRYGVVSIHRNELLAQKALFERTIKILADSAKNTPLVFVQHPITFEWIKTLGLESLAEKAFIYAPKLDYFSFIKLLSGASFVVTDSGGLQEECTYLGIPCLIHRKATERMEGLDSGITKLSYYDDKALVDFLQSKPKKLKPVAVTRRPSDIILDYLEGN